METEPLSEMSVFRMLNCNQIMAKALLQCHNCGGVVVVMLISAPPPPPPPLQLPPPKTMTIIIDHFEFH